MRHHADAGVAPQGQLQLFDPWTVQWTSAIATAHDGGSQRQAIEQPFSRSTRFDRLRLLLDAAERETMSGTVRLHIARSLAIDALRVGLAGTSDTVEDTLTCVAAFFDYANHYGAATLDDIDEELVVSFIHRAHHRAGTYKDPSPSTAYNRRWQVGKLFEALTRLGAWDGPVQFGEPIRKGGADRTRPLTAMELGQVRDHSYYGWLEPTRRPIVIALSEAGGSAGEIATTGLADIDFDGHTVTFHGTHPRTNRIPEVALAQLREALDAGAAVGKHRLAVGDQLDHNNAKRSVTLELSKTIRAAGLARVPRVSGRSIRLHHALAVFHADGLAAAVRFLGADSFDTTIRALGLSKGDL